MYQYDATIHLQNLLVTAGTPGSAKARQVLHKTDQSLKVINTMLGKCVLQELLLESKGSMLHAVLGNPKLYHYQLIPML